MKSPRLRRCCIAAALAVLAGLVLQGWSLPHVQARPAADTPVMTLAATGPDLLAAWQPAGGGYRTRAAQREGHTATVYEVTNPNPEGEAGLMQRLAAPEGGTYLLSGWSRAQEVQRHAGTEYFSYCLAARAVYADGSAQWFHTTFSLGSHDWEYREISFTLTQETRSLTVYAFLRAPMTGEALFDGIRLVRGAAGSATFQNRAVTLAEDTPSEEAAAWLRTENGLSLGLGEASVPRVAIDGNTLPGGAPSGFLVQDVADDAHPGVYGFTPSAGSQPAAFRGEQAALGLSLRADYTAADSHIAVSGVITDSRGDAEGRSVQLSFALPVTATGWHWGRDIARSRVVRTGTADAVYKELGDGCSDMTVVDWDSAARSLYPYAAIYNDDLGLAIAVSPDIPAYYELEYNGSTGQFVLTYSLGIVPEAPEAARFAFVIYKLDEPAWGMRSAAETYAQLYPWAFEVREQDQGLWVAWINLSGVPQPEDFHFRFKEEGGEYYRIEGDFEKANGIKGYQYIEPGDWWLKDLPQITEACVRETIETLAGQKKSLITTKQALATAFCAQRNPDGTFVWNPADTFWAPHGAQIPINMNPRLPGEYNFYSLYAGPYQLTTLFDPRAALNEPFDGIYLDELSGWWIGNANFNREHYAYTSVPLTYSPYYRQPMLHRASTTWEFVKTLSEELHGRGKTLFANKCPDKTAMYVPFIDAMGTEQTAMDGDTYAPQSLELLRMWRTLAYQKPFCILLSNDYDRFGHAEMELYFQRCLAFGLFPSPCTSYADDEQYFTSPQRYYERDRDLFQKYLPVLKTVAEAGWEPVTAARADDADVAIERYGKEAGAGIYFTLYNPNDTPREIVVTLERPRLGTSEGCTYRELLSGQAVTLAGGQYRTRLEPGEVQVLAGRNPAASPASSSPAGVGGVSKGVRGLLWGLPLLLLAAAVYGVWWLRRRARRSGR